MSREYKISSVRQADDAINDLNDKMYRTTVQMARRISEAQLAAQKSAEAQARALVSAERDRMQRTLDREIAGVSQSVRDLDKAHRQRLQNTARQLENLIDSQADALRQETRQGLKHIQDNLDSLSASTRAQFAGVNARIDTVNALSKARFESVQKRVSELAADTMRRFDLQQRQLDSHQSQLDSHQHQLDSLRTTVNGILDRFADEHRKRAEAVAMAKEVYDAAVSRADLDRFVPEDARKLRDRMERLLADPDGYATVAQAVEAIMQIQWAEEEALKRKLVYDAILAQAVETLEAVLAEVSSNRQVSVTNPADSSDAVEIEVDFWNRGEYDAVSRELTVLRRELDSRPSQERIAEVMKRVAELEVLAADMVRKAADRSILSENRVVITEDIITALEQQGWSVERGADGRDAIGYEGGLVESDWREGFFAYLRSLNGERIVIRVTPSGDGIDNDIAFHRVDNRSVTSAEFMRSLQTLKAQIEKSGHRLGDIRAPRADGGDARLAEIVTPERLAGKGAAQSIRKKMRGA